MSLGVRVIVPYLEGLAASAVTQPAEAFERTETLQFNMQRRDYTETEQAALAGSFMAVYLMVHERAQGEVSRVAHLRVMQSAQLLAQTRFKDWRPV